MSGEGSAEFVKQFPLERPSFLERKAFSKENRTQYSEHLKALDKERLNLIVDVLTHPATERLIEQGNITLGAIKPNAQESRLQAIDDVSAEEEIFEHLSQRKDFGLQIMFAVSLKPSVREMEEFYKDVKENLQNVPHKDGGTIWDKVLGHMTSGPVTYFLLYSPDGNAVNKWRTIIGATDPAKADKDSVRGKFALKISNNLVHGSSGSTKEEAVANVKHEVHWLRDRLIDKQGKMNSQKPPHLSVMA